MVATQCHAITARRASLVFNRAIALGDAYAMDYAARIHEHNGNTDAAARLREQATTGPRYGWGLVQSPPPG